MGALVSPHQPVQQLQLQGGHASVELGGVGAGLLAALEQLKESGVHAEGLGRPRAQPLEAQDGGAQEGHLRGGSRIPLPRERAVNATATVIC